MRKKYKHGLQCILFLLCTLLAVMPLLNWFGYPAMDDNSRGGKMRFQQFYEEKKGTVQGVLVGTSSVHRAWVAPVAYEEEGITMYALSSSNQPLSLAISVIKQARKKQNIEYAVVDLRGIRMRVLGKDEAVLRHSLDNMGNGWGHIQAVKQTLEYNEMYNSLVDPNAQVTLDAASLYLPFLKYHTRWSSGLQPEDFSMTALPMKGVYDDKIGFKTKVIDAFDRESESTTLNVLQKRIFDDLIAYGEEEGIQLLFINVPATLKEGDRPEIDAAKEYLATRGYDVLDMREEETVKEIGLDYKQDFADKLHVNLKGAVKVTRYLSKYLSENYDIPDMRGREEYECWDVACDTFWEFYHAGWAEKEAKK